MQKKNFTVAVLDYDADDGDEDEYYNDDSANEKGERWHFGTLEIHLKTPTMKFEICRLLCSITRFTSKVVRNEEGNFFSSFSNSNKL